MINDKFLIREAAYQIFGRKAFEHALFYVHEQSLRLELSIGGSFIEMFHQAFSKGIEVLDNIFSKQDDLYACISFYGAAGLLTNLSVFKQLDSFDIKLDKLSCEIWQEQYSQEEDEIRDESYFRAFIIFPIDRTKMLSLLWSAVASDFNINPKIGAQIYLFSPELQILVHPYDDRGMDIIGSNYNLKKRLFNDFNDYLLDYDREIMNKHFTTS